MSKDQLLTRVTGNLKEQFESISDDKFASQTALEGKKKRKIKILSENCDEKSCSITYIIRYETYKNEEKVFVTEVKKIAELIKENGRWLISDITNIKTFHDSIAPI